MNNNNFSILERYGENFTDKEYVTNPAIGRDNEIKELLLVLLTPEKSAILIGKPGVGKTAIVEGLSYRIQQNDVPDLLKGYTIINIKTASLLGNLPTGESKVNLMIEELKEKDKIILFIDEIHMLIGSNETSSLDFANIFKEGLGRGGIKVIGATTTEEYEKYILRDKAFTRRFQKIEVKEPSREETIAIMMGTLPKIEKDTGAKLKYTNFIKENIMAFLVDLTSEYKRVFEIGSRYPDVSLTLLKQSFSYAIFENSKEVNIFHVQKAIENSKNVYPDVIKKDMPKFLEKFKDIISEEKGIDVSWNNDRVANVVEETILDDSTIKAIQKEKTQGNYINIPKYEDYMKNLSSNKKDDYDRNVNVPTHVNSSVIDKGLLVKSNDFKKIEELLNMKPVSINPELSDVRELSEKKVDINKSLYDLDLENNEEKFDDDFFE